MALPCSISAVQLLLSLLSVLWLLFSEQLNAHVYPSRLDLRLSWNLSLVYIIYCTITPSWSVGLFSRSFAPLPCFVLTVSPPSFSFVLSR